MNEREMKLQAIRNEMEDLLDKLTDHYQDMLAGRKPDTSWIANYPERFLTTIEQIELEFEYAK